MMRFTYARPFIVRALFVVAVGVVHPGAASAAPDPCSLLTPTQVGAVLGVAVEAGSPLASKACAWSAAGKAGANAKKVTVTLQDPRAFEYAKMPVSGRGISKTPVSGVGDDAVSGTSPAGTVLTVKKGSTVFVVHVFGFEIDDTRAKEKALALEILSKL